jgi:hypothetical protein
LKQYGKCPYCLQQIKYNFVNISEIERNWIDNTITKYNSKENDKIHNLIKIIQNNPNGKFLIFSNYSFNQIINFLDRKKITWKKLCGRPDIIKKLVNNYDKGIIKVLMLNAKYYGNGLNLQMTTDIIIFHKMDKNTKTQIIGRAQRVGRKYKLKIYELEYEHESEHEHEYET